MILFAKMHDFNWLSCGIPRVIYLLSLGPNEGFLRPQSQERSVCADFCRIQLTVRKGCISVARERT